MFEERQAFDQSDDEELYLDFTEPGSKTDGLYPKQEIAVIAANADAKTEILDFCFIIDGSGYATGLK